MQSVSTWLTRMLLEGEYILVSFEAAVVQAAVSEQSMDGGFGGVREESESEQKFRRHRRAFVSSEPSLKSLGDER